jgi:glycine/serine hydroxymethyltransferase
MKEKEMVQTGAWIVEALRNHKDAQALARIRKQVLELAEAFPLYPELRAAVEVA